MPIEVVSVSVREHQHQERTPASGENAFWSRVLDCGRETEVSRLIDKISKSLSNWSALNGKSCHLARKERFFSSTRQFFEEIAILWRNSSTLNDELRTTKVNFHTEKQRFQRLPTRNQRNSMRTVQLYNKRSTFRGTIPFHTSGFFSVSPIHIALSTLSVSLIIQIQNFAWVETIFDHGKRLRSPRRLQSRFRGTRTIQYAYWGVECQSERAPALGERRPSGVVSWTAAERYSRHYEPELERLKEYPERAECNVVEKSSFLPFRKIRLAVTHHRFGARRTVESRISSGLLFSSWDCWRSYWIGMISCITWKETQVI